ncbi:MAG: hypothetical protein ACK6DQ_00820, partial [Planctomycetota bacterium]
MTQAIRFLIVVSLALVTAPKSFAQELFSQLVGPIQVGAVESGPKASNKTVQVPYIVWGGDIATFL